MAKTGFWLKGAKGKMAGTTIYQSNGETVMRVINRSIKNPKTKAQLIQRIIAKTVMKQYSAMKAICDHSFEGVSAGANSMSRFATINNTLLRERIAKAQQEGDAFSEIYNFIPLKTAKFIPAYVQISEGSLPQVIIVRVDDDVVCNLGNVNTYEGIINYLGLERGDQLTFITVEKINGNYQFKYARVILDPREADGSAAPLSTAFVDEHDNVVKPSFRNEGTFNILTFDTESGTTSFSLQEEQCIAGAVIVSRKVNNDWLRSKAMLNVNGNAFEDGDNISLQQALDLAIQGTEIYTDSERYLNNAGEGGPQAAESDEWANPYPNAVLLVEGDATEIKEFTELEQEPSEQIVIEGLGDDVVLTAQNESGASINCEYDSAAAAGGQWQIDSAGFSMPVKVFVDGTLWFTFVDA